MGESKRCKKCSKTFNTRAREEKLTCSSCNEQLHLQCSEIDNEMYKMINISNNVKYVWDTCNSGSCEIDEKKIMSYVEARMNDMFKMFTSKLDEAYDEIAKLRMTMNSRDKVVSHGTPLSSGLNKPKRKWSEIVESDEIQSPMNKLRKTLSMNSPIPNNDDVLDVLVVQPLTDEISDDQKNEMKKIVTSAIHPTKDPVLSYRVTSKGKIILKCKDNDSMKVVSDKLKSVMGDEYSVDEPRPSKPKIRINNISDIDYCNEDQLINCIMEQNKDSIHKDTNIKVMKINNHSVNKSKWHSAIICVDKITFDMMMKRRSLKIGWSNCKINAEINVLRCFKCNDYNHKADECKSNSHVCPKCSGSHKISECKSKEVKCCNCIKLSQKTNINIPLNHYSWSDKCIVYQRKFLKMSKKVRYEK